MGVEAGGSIWRSHIFPITLEKKCGFGFRIARADFDLDYGRGASSPSVTRTSFKGPPTDSNVSSETFVVSIATIAEINAHESHAAAAAAINHSPPAPFATRIDATSGARKPPRRLKAKLIPAPLARIAVGYIS